jgi:hypothetical protein
MERRHFKRLPAESQVTIRAVPAKGAGKGSGKGTGKNISGSGILISSDTSYEPGRELEIEVLTATHRSFSHVFAPLQARVRVVRVVGERPPYDIAAEFISVKR